MISVLYVMDILDVYQYSSITNQNTEHLRTLQNVWLHWYTFTKLVHYIGK